MFLFSLKAVVFFLQHWVLTEFWKIKKEQVRTPINPTDSLLEADARCGRTKFWQIKKSRKFYTTSVIPSPAGWPQLTPTRPQVNVIYEVSEYRLIYWHHYHSGRSLHAGMGSNLALLIPMEKARLRRFCSLPGWLDDASLVLQMGMLGRTTCEHTSPCFEHQ